MCGRVAKYRRNRSGAPGGNMAVLDNPRGEGGRTTQSILRSAAAALALRVPGVPEVFLEDFFSQALSEDLECTEPQDLAAIADDAWAFFAQRTPGVPKLRLIPSDLRPGISILDIVNDDMPFLLDSVVDELNERALDIRLLVHPVFTVERDAAGALTGFGGARRGEGKRESLIHIHIDGLDDDAARADVLRALEGILAEVRVCVQDWRPMLVRVSEIIADLRANPPPLPIAEIDEAIAFLEWLAEGNFVLLGARDYDFKNDVTSIEPDFETGLGLLQSRDVRPLQRWNRPLPITPEIREVLEQPRLLLVTKSTIRSRVHRRADLDYIGIKRFDRDGKLLGEHRICGLFTSSAYTAPVRAIPYLRRKADTIIRRAGFEPNSHSGKALVNVLENYPRDELFQIDDDLLYQFALAILQLDERPRVRVLPRRDRFDRFVSVLVYVPRERYDGRIRALIGDYLSTAFNGEVRAFYPFFTDGPLVRVHFIIGRSREPAPDIDRATLEQAVGALVRTWMDELANALAAAYEPGKAHALASRYRGAFPIDYREVYSPAMAVGDIRVVEQLTPERPLGVEFYREAGMEPSCAGLKVFSASRPIPLSERVPVLENMGFSVVDERTYHIRPQDAADVWFHD